MKRKLLKLSLLIGGFIAIIFILNIQVITKQGINYNIHTVKIPFYLKVLDFLDRHYNYRQLVKSIVDGAKSDKERVMRLFEWTYKNIRRAPEGMPLMDDHVWYTIVRGYGVSDQFSDVFTTLCNYAGAEAFYSRIGAKNSERRMIFSFVRINGKWSIFDPYNGVYFKNDKGEFAGIEEITRGDCLVERIGADGSLDVDYANYLGNLSSVEYPGLQRANIQSPVNRLKYEIKRYLKAR